MIEYRTFIRNLIAQACMLLAAMVAGGPVLAAETGSDLSKFAAIPPGADLVAAAETHKIPLSGNDPLGPAGVLNPGDSFSAIVTLCEKGGKRTQWLLYLTALAASSRESRNPPEPVVVYSGRSNRFEFATSPALVRLETLGPFTGTTSKKTKAQSETFSLDKGLLSLGLDQAAAIVLHAIQSNESGHFYFDSRPPNATQMANARRVAEKLKLTVEQERALGGGFPALFSYFDVIQHTEGLEDILLRVVRKPSLWSVIRHIGVKVNLRFELKQIAAAEPALWTPLTTAPLYYFPLTLELNSQPALKVTFVVTDPRPPLLSCGGIIGMLAERPGDKETYLMLRIVSAKLGAGIGLEEPVR